MTAVYRTVIYTNDELIDQLRSCGKTNISLFFREAAEEYLKNNAQSRNLPQNQTQDSTPVREAKEC
jgi:hypothetical protein